MYGEDSEAFEQESQTLESADLYDNKLCLWHKKDPIGKLHNIVEWIRSSPQYSEYFQATISEAMDSGEEGFLLHKQSSFEVQLVACNDTQWNWTNLMIDRAITIYHDIRTFLLKNEEEPGLQKHISAADYLNAEY